MCSDVSLSVEAEASPNFGESYHHLSSFTSTTLSCLVVQETESMMTMLKNESRIAKAYVHACILMHGLELARWS